MSPQSSVRLYDYEDLPSGALKFMEDIQPINPRLDPAPGRKFHPFPRLPAELRIMIWRRALPRKRLISMQLMAVANEEDSDMVNESHKLENSYAVYVNGYQMNHTLLSVCRESRVEVLKVYRVHIPCSFVSTRDEHHICDSTSNIYHWYKSTPTTLYFSPEDDVLQIAYSGFFSNFLAVFIHFTTRLKMEYDPRHVGLLILVLDRLTIVELFTEDIRWQDTNIPDAFRETIAQLRQFWYNNKTCHVPWMRWMPLSASRFTIPRMVSVPNFELLEADLRHIPRGDSQVSLVIPDWKRLEAGKTALWKKSLMEIGVALSDQTTYQIMYSNCYWDQVAWDRDSVDECFSEEYQRAHAVLEDNTRAERPFIEDMQYAVCPAVGFWLLPLEGFGDSTDGAGNWAERNSSFRPQLALSTLR